MSDFVRKFAKFIDADLMSDRKSSAEYGGTIDTGSLMLNALLSASVYGGMADNKVLAFAGEEATGKTFLALGIERRFLDRYDGSFVAHYDTESAVTDDMMRSRGIDTERVLLIEPESVQDFRTKAIDFLAKYTAETDPDRPRALMTLDSLGMLPTLKEVDDSTKGNDTRDMTKAQLLKGLFRVLRLRLARARVPMLVTNHVYSGIGPYAPAHVMGGGSGLKYAADGIVFLTKKKDREDDGTVGGVIVTATAMKSRLSRQDSRVSLRIDYRTGLDRWYGVREFAEQAGIITRPKGAQKYTMPDGTTVYGKHLDEDPERYFGPLLDRIDERAREVFAYGAYDDTETVDPETGEVTQ